MFAMAFVWFTLPAWLTSGGDNEVTVPPVRPCEAGDLMAFPDYWTADREFDGLYDRARWADSQRQLYESWGPETVGFWQGYCLRCQRCRDAWRSLRGARWCEECGNDKLLVSHLTDLRALIGDEDYRLGRMPLP